MRAIFSSRGGTHFHRSRLGRREEVRTKTGWSSARCEISDNRTDRLTSIRGSQDVRPQWWSASREKRRRITAVGNRDRIVASISRHFSFSPSRAFSSNRASRGIPASGLASKGPARLQDFVASRVSSNFFSGKTHSRSTLNRISRERRIQLREMSMHRRPPRARRYLLTRYRFSLSPSYLRPRLCARKEFALPSRH